MMYPVDIRERFIEHLDSKGIPHDENVNRLIKKMSDYIFTRIIEHGGRVKLFHYNFEVGVRDYDDVDLRRDAHTVMCADKIFYIKVVSTQRELDFFPAEKWVKKLQDKIKNGQYKKYLKYHESDKNDKRFISNNGLDREDWDRHLRQVETHNRQMDKKRRFEDFDKEPVQTENCCS